MQPSRRWILGGLGILVAAPSIVRASSLMTMPRAPVWVPPSGLWIELWKGRERVATLPASLWTPSNSLTATLDACFTMPRSMSFDQVVLHDGDRGPLVAHIHHSTWNAAAGDACVLPRVLGDKFLSERQHVDFESGDALRIVF